MSNRKLRVDFLKLAQIVYEIKKRNKCDHVTDMMNLRLFTPFQVTCSCPGKSRHRIVNMSW